MRTQTKGNFLRSKNNFNVCVYTSLHHKSFFSYSGMKKNFTAVTHVQKVQKTNFFGKSRKIFLFFFVRLQIAKFSFPDFRRVLNILAKAKKDPLRERNILNLMLRDVAKFHFAKIKLDSIKEFFIVTSLFVSKDDEMTRERIQLKEIKERKRDKLFKRKTSSIFSALLGRSDAEGQFVLSWKF